jgi:hypothetical protein
VVGAAVTVAKAVTGELEDNAAAPEQTSKSVGGKAIPDRVLGSLAGRAVIPADFDAPLPDDLLDTFEGR